MMQELIVRMAALRNGCCKRLRTHFRRRVPQRPNCLRPHTRAAHAPAARPRRRTPPLQYVSARALSGRGAAPVLISEGRLAPARRRGLGALAYVSEALERLLLTPAAGLTLRYVFDCHRT